MYQFLCDSWYDLFHLNDTYGQETLHGWWIIRCVVCARLFGKRSKYDEA